MAFVPHPDFWYPLPAAAEFLKRAESSLRDLVNNGEVRAKRQNKLLLIRPCDVMRYYEGLEDVEPKGKRGRDAGKDAGGQSTRPNGHQGPDSQGSHLQDAEGSLRRPKGKAPKGKPKQEPGPIIIELSQDRIRRSSES